MSFANDIALRIRAIFDKRGMTAAIAATGKLKREQQQLDNFTRKYAASLGLTKKQAVAAFRAGKESARRFRSEFLSLMFFGMALERMFGGLLRASWATFKQMTEGTEKSNNAMTHLSAAWEFFKFSLFEALLRSPVFQTIIDWAMSLIDWFASLSNKTQSWLAGLILVTAVVGVLLTGFGIMFMGLAGIGKILHSIFLTTRALFVLFGLSGVIAGKIALITTSFIAVATSLAFIMWRVGGLWEFIKAFSRGVVRAFAFMAQMIVDTHAPVFKWLFDRFVSLLNIVRKLAQAYDAIRGTRIADMLPSATEVNRLRAQLFKEDGVRELAEMFIANNKFLQQRPETTFDGFTDFLLGRSTGAQQPTSTNMIFNIDNFNVDGVQDFEDFNRQAQQYNELPIVRAGLASYQ